MKENKEIHFCLYKGGNSTQ